MKEVVYIAELDQDVDDVIAAEYLHNQGVLKEVVCDPAPTTEQGLKRKQELEHLDIKVSNKMPPVAKYVFVGGALTLLSKYLINHKVDCLVMNGGFVGCNIMKRPLPKFKDKEVIRTFNFNSDVNAADTVLRSKNIDTIVLVGKNVCHDRRNTSDGIWACERPLLTKYCTREDKRQHDLLACYEGLIMLGMSDCRSYLEYKIVHPYNTGLKGTMTAWGSTFGNSPYRSVLAAVDWRR